HNTSRGAALGGCRMWAYESEEQALTDALRLSRAMTYKSALAELPLGGGKAVIIADPWRDKTQALLRAVGRFIDSLGGRYITAEDSGTGVEDLKVIARETKHVAGIADRQDADGNWHSADPSPATAYGVLVGIEASVQQHLGRGDLEGVRVAIQGLGHVGWRLAEHLRQAGALLWVTDILAETRERAAAELDARVVEPEAIYTQPVDVFAPCALGAVLNDQTIARLQARVVAGSANNQLAEDRHGEMMWRRGILYAPDYVINAGGVIDLAQELGGYDPSQARSRVTRIADTLIEIYRRAHRTGSPTNRVADHIAEERFQLRRGVAAA
ncbi:MAG: amino acid dehydrogenase, partial [Nitrococcus sp.]|nr:amino acid dehydrogenase [Nitrococcus sp.]